MSRHTVRAGRRGLPARVVLAVWLAAAVLAPVAAIAQTESEEEDPLRQAARERYLRGRQLLQDGSPVEALQELAASYQLYPSWASLYGMAMCQEALGRPAAALELYQQVLRDGGDGVPDQERVNIGTRIAEIQAQIGTTPPTAATGRLEVHSTPSGAAILVDGESSGSAPLRLDLSVGPHRLEARLDGYDSATRWIDVVEGQPTTVNLELAATGAAPAGDTGSLLVRSEPPGSVFIDDQPAGATPTGPIAVSAGSHLVRVVDDAGRTWEEEVAVAAGASMVVDVRLGATAGLDPLWFWLTAGTAGALAVGGAATGGYVLSLKDEYDDPATSPSRRDEIKSSGDPLRIVTDALLGAAGALAIGAITLVFFTDFSGESGTADVRPLDQTGTGVADRGAREW
jgi:hypothetical protein